MALQEIGIEFIVEGAAQAQSQIQNIDKSLGQLSQGAKNTGPALDAMAQDITDTGNVFSKFAGSVGELASSALPALTTALAGMGAVATTTLAVKAWEGFNVVTQIEQNTKALGTLMHDQERANDTMQRAIAFGQQYGYTQAEMASSVQSATQIIMQSKRPLEEQLSALARLATLNPQEGFEGAVFAMKELASGDILSLVERFNLSKDAATKMRDAIRAGADPIQVLNTELERMNVTQEVLANRMEGSNGALLRMQLAGEKAAMTIGTIASPAIVAGLEKIASLLNTVSAGAEALAGGNAAAQTQIEGKLVAGATTYEQYVMRTESANAQLRASFGQNATALDMFVLDMIGVTPTVDRLTEAEWRFVQSLTASGVPMQQAMLTLQGLGDHASQIGIQFDTAFSALSVQAPVAAAAFEQMAPAIYAVAGRSEDAAIQVEELLNTLANDGDVWAFKKALDELGGTASLTQWAVEGLKDALDIVNDAVDDAHGMVPPVRDDYADLAHEADNAAMGIWMLTDAQYANVDADLAKQITGEQQKVLQADLELAVLKVENGTWSQAAAMQYLASQYGLTAIEAENLFNKQADLAVIQGQVAEIRKNIAAYTPPRTGRTGGGRGRKSASKEREEKKKTPEEMMSDTFSLIEKGVDAFGKLESFIKPSQDALKGFTDATLSLVQQFYADMGSVQAILTDKAAEKYAKAAKDAVDVVASGVDALMKLDSFKAPSRDAITSFSITLRDVVADFYTRGTEVAYALDVIAPLFMKSAKQAVELIGAGVDSLMKLHAFKAPARETLFAFSMTMRDAVADFWHRAQEVSYTFNDQAATKFHDAAQKAVATIGAGVEALMKLHDYVSPSRDVLFAFSHDIRDAIADFWHRAQEVNYAMDETAPLFAEIGQKVTAAIGSAVDAFLKLQSYKGVPRAALDAVSRDIQTAVTEMSRMAAQFDADGTQAVAAFAEAVGKILQPFGDAIDLFGEFEAYSGIAPETMGQVGVDIELATLLMQDIADRANQDGVARAAEFSASVSTIFGALKTAIDALGAIREYESIPSERVGALLGDFMMTLGILQEMNAQAQTAVGAAESWRSSMQTIADSIRAGADIIGALNGLSVLSTISVGVGTTGGEGTTVATDATAAQAGGAMNSNTTINYNYNANYAAPPASPAVGFDLASSLAGA